MKPFVDTHLLLWAAADTLPNQNYGTFSLLNLTDTPFVKNILKTS
jgi:hypothetical protein